MVGGRNYRESQFNLAVQGQRQPGSAFKPFVLATALEKGISPATTMTSSEQSISLGDKLWTPHNYEDAYLGPITLETATVHSDNAVYAQLAALVGLDDVIRVARRMGVTSPMKQYFSLALGTQVANPLELARSYAAFANRGFRLDIRGRKPGTTWNRPRAVDGVEDSEGNVVDDFQQQPRRVLSARTVSTVNRLLQGVVREGTATRAAIPGWSVAGKTGTTENYGDAWFVGYTPSLVVAVWVGYPKGLRPMLTEFDGEPVTGGSFPAEIFKTFAEQALPYLGKQPVGFDQPPSDWVSPLTVVQRDGLLQRDNGNCRNAYTRPLLRRRPGRSGRRTASRTRWRSRTSSGASSRWRSSASRRSRSSRSCSTARPSPASRSGSWSTRSRARAAPRRTTRSSCGCRSRCTASSRGCRA